MTERSRLRTLACALAALFFAAHAAYLPATLEDIDSINFALGLHEFNPAKHQPHPPGYPVFMAAAKLSRMVMHSDASALAVLGAIFGALAVFALVALFRNVDVLDESTCEGPGIALLAVVVTVCSPLYWFNALRPMSDVPGLAVTLAAQAALATAYARQRLDPSRTPQALEASGKMIVLGAFLAAVAIGFRSQAAVLTLPLLILVLLQRAGRGAAGALLGSAMTFSLGILVWAVPLVVATGGVATYRVALTTQGSEDFTGVDMLYRHPTPRRFAIGLLQTFVLPWASTPLGWVVFVLAAFGMGMLLWRSHRAAILLLVVAAPYALFHLLFQETLTTRYALPLIPMLAYLAVYGLHALATSFVPRGRTWRGGLLEPASLGAAIIVVWSLVLTLPAARVYARDGSPAFAALAEMHRVLDASPDAAIGMHQEMLRSVQTQNFAKATVLKAPPMREWLELAAYWRDGNTAPVWFLQDPARTDTELIDPLSGTLHAHYIWNFQRDNFMSGVRPDIVDLIRFDSPPGWFGAEGWHLTPETLNMSERSGAHEAIAFVKTRSDSALMVIGAESLDSGEDEISVRIDERLLETWTLAPGGRLLQIVNVAAGVLDGSAPLKRLVVSYARQDGTPEKVRITQFALEPANAVFLVQHAGWNEIEYSRALQRRWRWTSGSAATFVNAGGRDVMLTIRGESPLTYFDRAPHVVVRAGDQILARAEPAADFSLSVKVPAAALASAGGMVTLETDETFVPHDRSGSPDRRTLGLRIFEFSVR